MKWNRLSVPKWSTFVTFVVTTAVFGFSCGSGSNPVPPAAPQPQLSYVDTVCNDAIFGLGRPLSLSDLDRAPTMGFSIREVHFRNVVLRGPNEVALAYRTKIALVQTPKATNSNETYLHPEAAFACNTQDRPSARALRMARVSVPVLNDLHLPSRRTTASMDPYSVPRIDEMSIMPERNSVWLAPNWGAYAKDRTISQYLDKLKYRGPFDRVEVREMADGWVGIAAEKRSGAEIQQLMILLARTYPNAIPYPRASFAR